MRTRELERALNKQILMYKNPNTRKQAQSILAIELIILVVGFHIWACWLSTCSIHGNNILLSSVQTYGEFVLQILPYIIMVIVIIGILFIVILFSYKLYKFIYFHSSKFRQICHEVKESVSDCNKLNVYIDSLKQVSIGSYESNIGTSVYEGTNLNYRNSDSNRACKIKYVYQCSRAVCDSSRRDPIKYLCKYFGFKADKSTLESIEQMLNKFSTVHEGEKLLIDKRDEIIDGVSDRIPYLIRKFDRKTLIRKFGFMSTSCGDNYFHQYVFQYISPGGRSRLTNTITLDLNNLDLLVKYLNKRIRWKKNDDKQRVLITRDLRRSILERDVYQCQKCFATIQSDPHLLFEVDYIVPLAEGGRSTEDNLQVICWRCQVANQ